MDIQFVILSDDPNDDYYCLSYIDKDSLPTDILDENTISEAEYEYNVYCSLFNQQTEMALDREVV